MIFISSIRLNRDTHHVNTEITQNHITNTPEPDKLRETRVCSQCCFELNAHLSMLTLTITMC